jgi:2,3-bisphosphoglycerate-independent phosphoglycerate mutase
MAVSAVCALPLGLPSKNLEVLAGFEAMKLLLLFLDGVGLGADDPMNNPFAHAHLPTLNYLLDGQRMLQGIAPFENQQVSLLALDACLGVPGLPQSATGQATLLTGTNVPALLGYHYGPKPNPPIAEVLRNGNLFNLLTRRGYRARFLNAYPPSYFSAIESRHRIYSAIPLAVTNAGIRLNTAEDLIAGLAISADFTAQGWRDRLGIHDAPMLTPHQAGIRLAELALQCDFSLFEYWLSDYVGHKQDMAAALALLETLDQVLSGLLSVWNMDQGLILVTSDHGNLEELNTRHHTNNPVPMLVIGSTHLRRTFCSSLSSLTDITPSILSVFP